MNEELTLEKLADLAVHYPEYLIDAAAEHFNGDECKLEAIAVVDLTICICRVPHCSLFGCFPKCLIWKLNFRLN